MPDALGPSGAVGRELQRLEKRVPTAFAPRGALAQAEGELEGTVKGQRKKRREGAAGALFAKKHPYSVARLGTDTNLNTFTGVVHALFV